MVVREGAVSSHQGGGRAQLPHAAAPRGVGGGGVGAPAGVGGGGAGGGGAGGIMDPLLGSLSNMKLITDLNDGVKSLAGSCTSPSVRGQRTPHAARPLRSQIAAGPKLNGLGHEPLTDGLVHERARARQVATAWSRQFVAYVRTRHVRCPQPLSSTHRKVEGVPAFL